MQEELVIEEELSRLSVSTPLVQLNSVHQDRLTELIHAHTAVGVEEQLGDKSVSHIPRSYQVELLEIAKQENVLVCLDTGSGKTLISVLLLQHVHQLQRATLLQNGAPKRKVSFFLVNLVPLVYQQSSVIAGNSDLKVGRLYGELKCMLRTRKGYIDSWRLMEWQALLASHDVIVATAQVVLDALIHGFIKMSDINLLIFDEVHHAVKNHPFFRIMKYYHILRAQNGGAKLLPKVFGMTASPIFSASGEFAEASAYLQRTMDARIFTASPTSIVDLEQVKQRPQELVVQYDAYDSTHIPHSSMTQEITDLFAQEYPEYIEQVQPKVEETLRQYGPLMCDLLWYSCLLDHKQRMAAWGDTSAQQSLLEVAWLLDSDQKSSRTLNGAANLSSNNELNKRILQHIKSQPSIPNTLTISASNCSDKILRFVQLLACFRHEADKFCGIVFVERRQTAYMLVELLKRLPELDFIQPECIIGHDSSNTNSTGMDWHQQVQILNRFRHRTPTNLLVATAIAEEGLDIQAANLVVRFDLFNRHISFLQSRGRARAKDSRLILMAERNNLDQQRLIFNAFRTEERRERWLDNMSETSDIDDIEAWRHQLRIEYQEQDQTDVIGGQSIVEPETGARLFPEDAPTVIAHYISTLYANNPKDGILAYKIETIHSLEAHELGIPPKFQCTLELPSNSTITQIKGAVCSSKKQAKRLAAFQACREFRHLGELDVWLMPKAVIVPLAANSGYNNPHHRSWAVSSKPVHVPVKIWQGWEAIVSPMSQTATAVYYATYLPLHEFDADCEPLMLLTRTPLPDTKLLALSTGTVFVDIHAQVCGPQAPFTQTQQHELENFTRQVFELACSKPIPADYVWDVFVAPARSTAPEIAFDLLTSYTATGKTDLDIHRLDEFAGRLIERTGGRKTNSTYRVYHSRPDINPENISYGTTTYLHQHAKKFGAHYIDGKNVYDVCDRSQSLLQVGKLPMIRNQLIHSVQEETRETKSHVIIPQFFRLLPISGHMANSVLLLPSILARYDQLLIAATCNKQLFADRLNLDQVAQALAAPSTAGSFSYERLEFLGDTFIKLVATCHTFTTRLSNSEGELHMANKAILTNARLLKEALRLKIWRYGSFSCPFIQPKRFLPPGRSATEPPLAAQQDDQSDSKWYKTTKGTFVDGASEDLNATSNDRIGEKGLSDIVEALIGAGLTSGGPDLALFVCHVVGLIPENVTTLSEFNTNFKQLKQHSIAQDWRLRVNLSSLHHIESLFKYEFEYPHLGLEAFTHPSLLASVLPSYQRLEFLGDAIIDYLVVMWMAAKYPRLGPGELTSLKNLLVSNNTLAVLGDVMGLPSFIASNSKVLIDTIQVYRDALATARMQESASTGVQYWIGIKSPKCIADVVESSIGAIVVDSGFELSTAEAIFQHHFVPFYEEFCRLEHTVVADAKAVVEFLISRKCNHVKLITNLVDFDNDDNNNEDDFLTEFVVQFTLHGATVAKFESMLERPEQLFAVRAIVRFLAPQNRGQSLLPLHEEEEYDAIYENLVAPQATVTTSPDVPSEEEEDSDIEEEEEERLVASQNQPAAAKVQTSDGPRECVSMHMHKLTYDHHKALRKLVSYLHWQTPFQPPLANPDSSLPPTATLGNLVDLCTC